MISTWKLIGSCSVRDIHRHCRHYAQSGAAIRYSDISPSGVVQRRTFVTDNALVKTCEGLLISVHDLSHLPWWSLIMTTGLGIRFVLLPVARIVYISNFKRSMLSTDVYPKEQEKIRASVKSIDSAEALREFKRKWHERRNELFRINKCHPFVDVSWFIFQFVAWVSFSIALGNVARNARNNESIVQNDIENDETKLPAMKTEGVAWIKDLTVPDKSWVLGVIIFTIHQLNLQTRSIDDKKYLNVYKKTLETSKLSAEASKNIEKQFRKYRFKTRLFRCLALLPTIFSTIVPSGIALYWVTSGFASLVQNLAFRSWALKGLLRIPVMRHDTKYPMRELISSVLIPPIKFILKQYSKYVKK